jgi:hypothetical protein
VGKHDTTVETTAMKSILRAMPTSRHGIGKVAYYFPDTTGTHG